MIKDWIRSWLGIDQVLWNLQDMRENDLDARKAFNATAADVLIAKTMIAVHNRAIGRLIAKLDPIYSTSEHDPARRAESDRIGDEVMRKLLAEHKASNPNV